MKNLTVVMYHYVRQIKDSRYPNVKGLEINNFIEQIRFFKENYTILTMEELIECIHSGKEVPPKSILLTFDDGYAEHFTNVYPVLSDFGVQGSFFIPVKPVLEHRLLDVNKIHFTLASVSDFNELIQELKADICKYRARYSLRSYEEYFKEFAVANRFDTKEVIFVKRMLQHALPEELRSLLSSKFFEKFVGVSETAFAKELYVNEHQVKQLVRDGMHVGCHGYDHYWWNKLDQKSLTKELVRSKEFLSSVGCDMQQWTACYPYGATSDSVVQELEKHGCALAFTTEANLVDTKKDNRLLYARLDTNDFPPKSTNYLLGAN